MASVSTVRAGLKDRLATITKFLQTYPTAPGTPMVPCAFVLPGPIEFDETMDRGCDDLSFTVVVLVAKATDQLAQENLDPYLSGSGAQSIKQAVEDETTPISGVDWVRVPRVTDYGDIEYNGVQYLGARFPVEVSADGT